MGIDRNVTFTGHRNDLREIMCASDIVFSLSSNPPESFGMTTLEALSLGIPVIGYNLGGTGEILRNLFTDGLVEPGNINNVIERIEYISLKKPAISDSNPYLIQNMLDRTVSCYEDLARTG